MANIDQKYFPALDGLRAICIAFVIFTHVPKAEHDILQHIPGWLGVDIFFVISGFLITTLSLREESANGKIDLYAFYVRRFFRIIPLYALILGFYVVQASTSHLRWEQMVRVLPYDLTFMNDLVATRIDASGNFTGVNRAPFGATWSLGIEEKFYLVWPFLFFVLMRQKKRLRLLVIPFLFAVTAFLPYRMFRSYFGLLLGCCLAIALAGDLLPRLRAFFNRIPAAVIFALVIGGAVLVDWHQKFVFLFSVICVFLVGSLVLTDTWLTKALSHRSLIWIGRRSYSMYLIQALVLYACEYFIPATSLPRQLALTVLGVAGSALGADLLYRFVEEPSRIYGKRLLARHKRPSSSITPSVT